MWVAPEETGIQPGYQQHEIDDRLLRSGLITIASGIPKRDAPITLHHSGAALHCARLHAGDAIDLPAAPYLHAFVARGRVTCERAGELGAGDAVRLTGTDGGQLTAAEPAEVLVWEMHAKLGG
jgi:redox-sensitive bicupin YhaK (pirin superfamily)